MYDFAHPLSDAKEGVTFSLCSLEFENHRPLYNWVVEQIGFDEPPRQIEFARLNINYCVTSKRKLLEMVNKGIVSGWDDPRMITLCGMRRRGYSAAAVRDFIDRVGVSKADSMVDYGLLEACVRDDLNAKAPRAMAVLRPLKVVIDNYPEGQSEDFEVELHPEHPEFGTRKVTFSRELYVERDDFMAEPVKKYFRLFPGNEVRFKSAYFVKCNSYDTDENGNVTCLHCTYDPESRGGNSPTDARSRALSIGSTPMIASSARFVFTTGFSVPKNRARTGNILTISIRTHLRLSIIVCLRVDLKAQNPATHSSL